MSETDILYLPHLDYVLRHFTVPSLTTNKQRETICQFEIEPACDFQKTKHNKWQKFYAIRYNHPRLMKGGIAFEKIKNPTRTHLVDISRYMDKPLTYLTDFYHAKKGKNESIHLLCKSVIFDTTAWLASKKVSKVDLIAINELGNNEYVFVKNLDSDLHDGWNFSIYEVLADGTQQPVMEFDELVKVYQLLYSVQSIVNSIYRRRNLYAERILEYMTGFISRQYYKQLTYFAVRDAYNHYIQLMYSKFKDLHIIQNKMAYLFLDRYWQHAPEDRACAINFNSDSDDVRDVKIIIDETIKLRENVLHYLELNDTKNARKQLLYGYSFTPALANKLIDLPVLYTKRQIKVIYHASQQLGSDKLLALINIIFERDSWVQRYKKLTNNNRLSINFYLNRIESPDYSLFAALSLIAMGFSYQQIYGRLASQKWDYDEIIRYHDDCIRMYRLEKKENPDYEITHKKLTEWHDSLVRSHQNREKILAVKERIAKEIKYNIPIKSRFPEKEIIEGYTFMPAQNAKELLQIGDKLRNCIGYAGYIEELIKGRIEIVTAHKDGELLMVAEIEVMLKGAMFDLRQAKLYWNNPIKKNRELHIAFMKWMTNHQVFFSSCSDVLVS